jgi:hypothetical protein
MATLHQVSSAKDGDSFIAIGPVTVIKHIKPKWAKNDRLYSGAILQSAGNEMHLGLWDSAAKWKLPLNVPLTLRGKLVRESYQGGSLRCEELTPPEGSLEWPEEDVRSSTGKPKLQECIDAGLRAADYLCKKNRPELAEAAFSFAANAFIQGVKLE